MFWTDGKLRRLAKAAVAASFFQSSGALDCATPGQAYYASSWPSTGVLYLATPEACQAACMGNPSCNVWTFLSDSASCWQLQKSEETHQAENAHATSGTRKCKLGVEAAAPAENASLATAAPTKVHAVAPTAPPLDIDAIMADTEKPACSSVGKAYTDPEVKHPNGGYLANAKHCQMACQYNANCSVFTFYVDSKACWLLGKEHSEFVSELGISGPKSCASPELVKEAAAASVTTPAPPNASAVTTATPACADRGNALRDSSVTTPVGVVADAQSCQGLCAANVSCVYFTFYVNSMACWLQGEQSVEFPSEYAISGPKACASPVVSTADSTGQRETLEGDFAANALIDEDLLPSRHSTKTVPVLSPRGSWAGVGYAIVGISMLGFAYVGCTAVKAMQMPTRGLRSFARAPSSDLLDEEASLARTDVADLHGGNDGI